MPIYEYQCDECGHRTEAIQRLSDPPLSDCGECGGPVRRLISAPAVQFKGSGWYVTDYAGRKGGDDGSSSKGDTEKSAPSSDAKSDKPVGDKPAGKATVKSSE